MEIIGKRTVWQGAYIKSVEITYKDRRGALHKWEAVERVGVDGIVVCVPFTIYGDVLLVRQYRPAVDAYAVELPAGLVEKGEAVLAAARREVIEETGHVGEHYKELAYGIMSTGITNDVWHVVLADRLKPATADILEAHPPDATEDIEVLTLPIAGLSEGLGAFRQRGDMVDLRIEGLVSMALSQRSRP